MRLTRKKAIALCIELWEWLAETGKRKDDWPGWKKYGYVYLLCFFCEYGQQRRQKNKSQKSLCIVCPLYQLKPPKGCYSSAYKKWADAITPRSRKKYAKLFLAQIKEIK